MRGGAMGRGDSGTERGMRLIRILASIAALVLVLAAAVALWLRGRRK